MGGKVFILYITGIVQDVLINAVQLKKKMIFYLTAEASGAVRAGKEICNIYIFHA